jgi:hypothetical protein
MKYLILLLLFIPTPAKAFTTNDVFNAVNTNRRIPLVRNVKLDKAAQAKANALSACSCFTHTLPDGRSPWLFIQNQGYAYKIRYSPLSRQKIGFNKIISDARFQTGSASSPCRPPSRSEEAVKGGANCSLVRGVQRSEAWRAETLDGLRSGGYSVRHELLVHAH